MHMPPESDKNSIVCEGLPHEHHDDRRKVDKYVYCIYQSDVFLLCRFEYTNTTANYNL